MQAVAIPASRALREGSAPGGIIDPATDDRTSARMFTYATKQPRFRLTTHTVSACRWAASPVTDRRGMQSQAAACNAHETQDMTCTAVVLIKSEASTQPWVSTTGGGNH